MSYTPIEGGLPQNLLDEFRSISAAFARLQLQMGEQLEELRGEVTLPETPSFEESAAYQDLNREIADVEAIMQEKLAEYNTRIERVRQELGDAVVDYHLRDDSITGQIEELKGTLLELGKDGSTLSARVWEEIRTRISETGALAERVTLLEVSGGGYDDTALWAAVATEQQARIDGDTALASDLTLLGAANGGGTAFVLNQSTVEVSPGTSWASWEVTLQASIDGKATIAQWQEVRDDTDGLLAKAGLQLNVNGHIIGWALNNNGDSGDMVIQVDRFFIVDPGETPTQIFYADATGVYMDTAFIRELTVDVLTAGTLSVPINVTGSITIPASGHIKSGQTAWNVGTGWWLGHVDGAPKFSIGAPASDRIVWSPAGGLEIAGVITALAGSAIDYSDVDNGPPSDADATATVINGGLITTGGLQLSTNGYVRGAKANYADDATSGFFLGRDGATPKLNIGNASQFLKWTGSALVVGGPIISTSNLAANAISTRASGTLATRALAASWAEAVLSPLVTTGSQTHAVVATISFTVPTDTPDRWVSVRLRVDDLDSADTYTTPVHRFHIPGSGSSPWPCNVTFTIPVTWTSSLGVQVTPEFFANTTFSIADLRLDAVGMRR